MWGRSAFYQPGGAFGFRDQLQDAAAWSTIGPTSRANRFSATRASSSSKATCCTGGIADTGFGLRTRFSDDLCLAAVCHCRLRATTGDEALLDEVVPFIDGAPLKPAQAECV